MTERLRRVVRRVLPRRSLRPERENPLARQRRQMRARFFGTAAMLCMGLAVIVVVAGWVGYRKLRSSNLLQISRIEVQGNRAVLRQQIIETAGLGGRQLLMDINCREVEQRLMGHPWIKGAQVERQWPSTVRIAVAERRPLALVNVGGQGRERLHYLDGDGKAFAPVLASQDIDFPFLSGVDEFFQHNGGKIAQESPAAEALLLLRLSLGDPILPAQAISEINLHPKQGLVMYLADRPFPILLGQGGMRGKFRRLTAVLKDLYRRDGLERVSAIRLDAMENRVLVAQREL